MDNGHLVATNTILSEELVCKFSIVCGPELKPDIFLESVFQFFNAYEYIDLLHRCGEFEAD